MAFIFLITPPRGWQLVKGGLYKWFQETETKVMEAEEGFPCGLAGRESACDAGDLGWIPGWGRSLGEGKGSPLQYSGLENPADSPWGCKEADTTERLSVWQKLDRSEWLMHADVWQKPTQFVKQLSFN